MLPRISAPRSGLYNALGWLVTLLTPVVLVLTAVRLLMMPAFLSFEYNTPNFPPDFYSALPCRIAFIGRISPSNIC